MTDEVFDRTLMEYRLEELAHREAYLNYLTDNTVRDADKNIDFGIVVKKRSGIITLIQHDRYSLPDYHTHDYIELLWIYRGEFINVVEGEPIKMRAGDVCLFTPGVYHFVDVSDMRRRGECAAVNLLINVETASELNSYMKNSRCATTDYLNSLLYSPACPQYRLYTGVLPECTKLFRILVSVMLEGGEYAQLTAVHLLCAAILILDLGEAGAVRNSGRLYRPADPLNSVIQYIYGNFNTVTLGMLAERYNYSSAYLCRMIKERRGVSFKQLLTDIRLSRACSLLAATSEQAGKIAAEVGYENTEHFHRIFKKAKGMTPLEYRAIHSGG